MGSSQNRKKMFYIFLTCLSMALKNVKGAHSFRIGVKICLCFVLFYINSLNWTNYTYLLYIYMILHKTVVEFRFILLLLPMTLIIDNYITYLIQEWRSVLN